MEVRPCPSWTGVQTPSTASNAIAALNSRAASVAGTNPCPTATLSTSNSRRPSAISPSGPSRATDTDRTALLPRAAATAWPGQHRHPGPAQQRHPGQTPRQQPGLGGEGGHQPQPLAPLGRVDYSDDLAAALHDPGGDGVEQRADPGHDRPRAGQYALRFQQDRGAGEPDHTGQRPAGEGDDPLRGARCQDEGGGRRVGPYARPRRPCRS